MRTDQKGEVRINNLKEIDNISIKFEYNSKIHIKSWSLNNLKNNCLFKSKMTFKKGDPIIIAIDKRLMLSDIRLFKCREN